MMTFLRRSTQLALIAAAIALGVLLVLEITDVMASSWRADVADGTRNTFAPDFADWALAPLGVLIGLVGVVLIAAQLAPAPRGTSRMLEVASNDDGATHLAGRAAMRAVEHELQQIVGVTGVTASMAAAKRIHAIVRIDDRSDIATIEDEARTRLDTPFWIDLGLADVAVDITAEFDPRPPRVR